MTRASAVTASVAPTPRGALRTTRVIVTAATGTPASSRGSRSAASSSMWATVSAPCFAHATLS